MTRAPRLAAAAVLAGAALMGQPAAGGVPEGDGAPAPPYSLHDLIRLAVMRDPGLAELRGEVAIAIAEARAVNDWEDPEVRVSYRENYDVELPPGVKETRTTTTRERGSSSTSGSQTRNEDGGGGGERFRESESFDETTKTTTTRRITPTANGERIVEETREATSGSSRRTQSGAEFSETEAGTTRERVTGSTVEDRHYDFNRLDPDSDFSVELRFRLPNPFERKPLLKRARHKITMAESLLRAGEHAVAIEVRKAYADLLAVHGEIRSVRDLGEVQGRLLAELDGNPRSRLETTIALSDDAFRTELELIPLSAEFDQLASELAALAGVGDASLIALDSPIAPRRIDLDGLDTGFLQEVAQAYRADIVELLHRASMSDLELKAHKASRIPWFNFVEGFYGVDYDRGTQSSDAIGFQVGISLPLFSWFKNKEHEIYERERESYVNQAAMVGARIRAQVELSVRNLRRASDALERYDQAYAAHRETITEKLEAATAAGFREIESRMRAEEALARLGERRFRALAHYNDAVLALEAALGTTLEDVFTRASKQGEAPPTTDPPRPAPALAGGGEASAAGQEPAAPASGPGPQRRPRGAPHRR